jgi:hypothetical protein
MRIFHRDHVPDQNPDTDQSNLSLFFPSDRDFYFSINPWLKNFQLTFIEKWCTRVLSVGKWICGFMYKCLPFNRQTVIEKISAAFDKKN